jgi:hypothetical protein
MSRGRSGLPLPDPLRRWGQRFRSKKLLRRLLAPTSDTAPNESFLLDPSYLAASTLPAAQNANETFTAPEVFLLAASIRAS